MLSELRVENLLLIERAELRLSPSLNVLTGETGAGKTVLAHALDLLLGGRPRRGIVRPGADEAYVEGTFLLGEGVQPRLPAACAVDSTGHMRELVLARRVGADGRTRAYLNGRTVSVGDLREAAQELIVFYGQHEHRKLTLSAVQLQILDELCGDEHLERRERFAATLREASGLRAELERLDELASARDRELELLELELSQIDQASPGLDEHAELLAKRERLRRADALQRALSGAAQALSPEDLELPGAAQLAAEATAQLDAVADLGSELQQMAERSRSLVIEARDLAEELHRHRERLEDEGGELLVVEERLSVLERLMRRHGGSIEGVLDHAEHARARREELGGVESAREQVARCLHEADARLGEDRRALHSARSRVAQPLASAVREQLAALAMPDATFEVKLTEHELSRTGSDAVEFMLAANPGVAAAPLREIASGGELSRVMLAVSTACAQGAVDRPPAAAGQATDHPGAVATSRAVLVFDEIDAGIGGQTARAVGERLRDLGLARQVLCITHLPQIASLASRHFSIVKDTTAKLTSASVLQLAEPDVVSELVRMLGAPERDAAARKHALELRKAA